MANWHAAFLVKVNFLLIISVFQLFGALGGFNLRVINCVLVGAGEGREQGHILLLIVLLEKAHVFLINVESILFRLNINDAFRKGSQKSVKVHAIKQHKVKIYAQILV